ncbi:MAG TPA: hypothetical protein VNO81_11650 [Candidatus Nitrosotenuis sp.]|jgi:hypothetical protein|nr:hypothetical protein [Candidatus Nitrosotenuis sp.]
MDSGVRGVDPLSNKFHTTAAKNLMQVGMGAVRTQKEIHQEEGPDDKDMVRLSLKAQVTDPQELLDAGAASGEMAELVDDWTLDEEEARIRNERDRSAEAEEGIYAEGDQGYRRVNETLAREDIQRLETLEDSQASVASILGDVPRASLEPARNILAAQTANGTRLDPLNELKPVEGAADMELAPIPSFGVLDIHETGNQAVPAAFDENVPPEQKLQAADLALQTALASLPSEQQATVDELRQAVEGWAREQGGGVDTDLEFARRLGDLAAGWDHEPLRVASQSYLEARQELAAAGAGVA